jgi:excisionase family DNA binding protein
MALVDSGPKDLLTAREVAYRLSISRRTLYRMLARGEFPLPVRRSRRWVRWRTRDLQQVLDSLRPGA